MAISNSTSPEIIWGLGGPEEDDQLHHCCWTGCVGERICLGPQQGFDIIGRYWKIEKKKTGNKATIDNHLDDLKSVEVVKPIFALFR